MKTSLERRVTDLERVTDPVTVAPIVIYDPVTGRPLQPVPAGAQTIVWIPDNGRRDDERQSAGE